MKLKSFDCPSPFIIRDKWILSIVGVPLLKSSVFKTRIQVLEFAVVVVTLVELLEKVVREGALVVVVISAVVSGQR